MEREVGVYRESLVVGVVQTRTVLGRKGVAVFQRYGIVLKIGGVARRCVVVTATDVSFS